MITHFTSKIDFSTYWWIQYYGYWLNINLLSQDFKYYHLSLFIFFSICLHSRHENVWILICSMCNSWTCYLGDWRQKVLWWLKRPIYHLSSHHLSVLSYLGRSIILQNRPYINFIFVLPGHYVHSENIYISAFQFIPHLQTTWLNISRT